MSTSIQFNSPQFSRVTTNGRGSASSRKILQPLICDSVKLNSSRNTCSRHDLDSIWTSFTSLYTPAPLTRHGVTRLVSGPGKICWPGRWYGHRFQSCATLTPFFHSPFKYARSIAYSIIHAEFFDPRIASLRLAFSRFLFPFFFLVSSFLVFSLSLYLSFSILVCTSRLRTG